MIHEGILYQTAAVSIALSPTSHTHTLPTVCTRTHTARSYDTLPSHTHAFMHISNSHAYTYAYTCIREIRERSIYTYIYKKYTKNIHIYADIYIHTYVCIYTHTHVYIFMCFCMIIFVYLYLCMRIYIYICICKHTNTQTNTNPKILLSAF